MSAVAPWVQIEDNAVLKKAFAAALLYHPNEPFKAGAKVFPGNHTRALTAAQVWVGDPEVLQFQVDLLEEFGEDNFLPNKVMLARRIFELGENERASIPERLAAFRLYADVRGFIEKAALIQNNNVTLNQNRVMVVKDHGTDDDWEVKVAAQQSKLIEHIRD